MKIDIKSQSLNLSSEEKLFIFVDIEVSDLLDSLYKIDITDCIDLEEIEHKLGLKNLFDESIAEKLKLELVEGR